MPSNINAKEYLFRKFDSQYSLHDNTVRNVLELPNGKMCVQTLAMLNIFDGSSVVSHKYDMDKVPYAEYNAMKSIYCDSRDRVWLKNRDNIWAFDLNKEQFIYNIDSLAGEFTRDVCKVKNIFILDRDKYFTFDKENRTLYYFNDSTKHKFQIAQPDLMGDPLEITQSGDDFWILCSNGNISQFSSKSQCFIYIEQNVSKAKIDINRSYMVADDQGKLWIILSKNLICYDPKGYKLLSSIELPLAENDIFTSITNAGDGSIWVGTAHSGIHVINSESFSATQITYLDVVDGSKLMSGTDIAQLYTDSNKGVWVATDTEGLLYYHKDIISFNNIHNLTLSKGVMQDVNIKCMLNEDNGNILLGTIKGLYSYNPTDNSVTEVYPQIKNILHSDNLTCIGLYRDLQNRIWVGTFQNGAFCIDGDNIKHYYYSDMPEVDNSYIQSTTNLNSVRTFLQAPSGEIFVSYYRGLGILDEKSGQVELLNLGNNSNFSIIRGIMLISEDELLIHADNGLIIYDLEQKRVKRYEKQLDSCYDTCVDQRGLIWFASIDGLTVYDRKNNQSRKLNQNNGLSGSKIFSIEADENDIIWVATSAGISAVILQEEWTIDDIMVLNFSQEDGISGASFYYRSILLGADKKLYFGSSNGVTVVDPSTLNHQISLDATLMVETTLRDKTGALTRGFRNAKVPTTKVGQTSQITLKNTVSSIITFDFIASSFINPNHTKFCYKLENYDYDWITIDCEKMAAKASYSYLHPGKYTLMVKSASNGNWWGDQMVKIEIVVLPPWWISKIAFLVYSLVVLLMLYLAVDIYVKRKYARAIRLKELETKQREEELEAAKQSFFINVSHELRTPLSLILLPLGSIISKLEDSNPLKLQLLTMQRNAQNLKNLVDNLLNFRKLDMNCESLNPTMGDIQQFLHSTYKSFCDAANAKELNFSFECNEDRIYMSFDRSMMQKIINNLLSNAMKFTSIGGSVSLSLQRIEGQDKRQMVRIDVADTGVGIPSKDLNFIFDRFYQASNSNSAGSGIGLSLTKSYIELHGGEISVESTLDKGSIFTVYIPMDIIATQNEKVAVGSSESLEKQNVQDEEAATLIEKSKKLYKVLVVEDNSDLREYLARELEEEFDVVVAEDGVQGEEQARKVMPDIIISDVMMPLRNGYDLTKILKADIETSHIPIILLTVQSSDESRLSGYESGADAYISKPFSWGVLHARINNLIEERKSRSKKFIDDKEDELESLKLAPLDKKFIMKAIESIERNLDNTEYSVENMSEDLSMNRMSIYRKFKSIMEQTPADFIRNIRLKRAARWMEQGDRSGYLLFEMANKFGFNTPKYFTKHFKEMFSETPLHYASRFKNRDNL